MMKGIVLLSSIGCKGVGWVVVQGEGWRVAGGGGFWRGSWVDKATLDVIYNSFK